MKTIEFPALLDLVAQLNQATPGRAVVLPIDGYHYDNKLLGQFGRLALKSAPATFDYLDCAIF